MEKELKILGETLKAQQEAINTALELLEVMTGKLNAKESSPEVEEKEEVKKAPKEAKKPSKKKEEVKEVASCITEEEEKNVREALKEFSVNDITDFLMEKEIEYDEGKASGKGNKLYVVRLIVDKLKDGTISLDDLFGEDEEDIEEEEVKEAEDVVEEAEETVEETTEDDEEENEEEEVKERTIDDIIEDYELKDMDKDGLKEIADELELKISGFDKKPVSILRKTIAKALLEAENEEEEEEDAKKK